MKHRALLLFLAAAFSLAAQEPANPPAAPKAESKAESKPVSFAGEWEIHVGGRATGIVIEISQSGGTLTGTYKEIPANNRYGIRPGFDFLNASTSGTGSMTVRKGDVTKGKPVEKSQSPLKFTVEEEGRRLACVVESNEIRESERQFQLVRQQEIKSLRLFTRVPGGHENAGAVIEETPMVVVIEMTGDTRRPVEVTLTSGATTLKLTASPQDVAEGEDGLPPGYLMTPAFLPTFGMALGVEPAPAPAAEAAPGREATEEDWKELHGNWRTLYKDGVLGNVTGWADVDEFGRLTLSYQPPGGGAPEALRLVSARVNGEVVGEPAEGAADAPPVKLPKLRLEFEGRGVTSPKIEPAPKERMEKFALDPETPEPITIKAGGFEAALPLARRSQADLRKVTLELAAIESTGALVWDWHYKAERATQRDREGLGRVGLMLPEEKETSTAKMSGREAWMRDKPQILAAYALEDQLALDPNITWEDRPVPKFRVGEKTRRLDSKGATDTLGISGNLSRTIFIIASDLPPAENGDLRLEAAGKGAGVQQYRVLARGTEADATDPALREAWKKHRAALQAAADRSAPEGVPAVAPKSDAVEKGVGVLANAILEPRATPGPQSFMLNGAEGSWQLLYGDATGRFMISRVLAESQAAEAGAAAESGELEGSEVFFVPETIRLGIEVETEIKGITEIPAVIGVQRSGAQQEYKKLVLKPDPNDARTYLSEPIELVREADYERYKDQPGALVLPVKRGDALRAQVADDSGYFLQPLTAQAAIEATPGNLSTLWKPKVKRAADLAGQPVDDWDEVARGTAANATNVILTEVAIKAVRFTALDVGNELSKAAFGLRIPLARWIERNTRSDPIIRSIPISIGDHAAMLLLRDEFVKLMGEQRAQWQRNQAPAAMRAIFESQRAAIAARQSPLSYVRVPVKQLQGYSEIEPSMLQKVSLFFREDEEPFLHMLLSREFSGSVVRVDKDASGFERLQWEAFKLAYTGWGALMQRSITDAQNLSDGDVHGLLKLTGMSFGPVVERLRPKLMKLDTGGPVTRPEADRDDIQNHKGRESRLRWVPDRVARAYVTGLGVLGSAVRAQEELSEADTRVIQATAALASVALGNVSGVWAAAAAVGISAADAAYAIYQDGYMNTARRDQLQFEIGAGAVLGADRAAQAEGKILSTLEQALSIGGSAFGLTADGAVLRSLKSAKALTLAETLDKAADILKNVDVADPAALRKLSKADAAVLLRAAEAAEDAAIAGRPTDLFKKIEGAVERKDDIFEALAGGTEAAGHSEKLKRVAESPAITLKRTELQEAGKGLDARIAKAEAEISDIKAKNPADGSAEAKLLDVKKGELDDLKQQKTVVDAMEQPVVRVPKRTAEMLTGEATAITSAERAAVDEASKLLAGGGRFSGEGLQKVNLTSAGKRLDDLIQQSTKRLDDLRANPAAAKAGELDDAARRLDDLQSARETVRKLDKSVGDASETRISQRDLDLINGARKFDELDQAEVHRAILASNGDWKQVVSKAKGTPDEQLLLHKVASYRRNVVQKLADEVITSVENATGQKGLFRDAFGSANLSSDYDVAFRGPGAELAVQEFNSRIRKVLGGSESGAVLDNNFYTDPVYNIYKLGGEAGAGGVTPAQLDTARQFFYQQMAGVKYRVPKQFDVFRQRMLSRLPEGARRFFDDMLDQAQGAQALAQERINKRLEEAKKAAAQAEEALRAANPTLRVPKRLSEAEKAAAEAKEARRAASATLRATNELYGDTLSSIHGYRQLVDYLDAVIGGGGKSLSSAPVPAVLQSTEFSKQLGIIQEMISAPGTRAAGLDALKKLRDRAVLNLRNEQGLALYYASEAYQAGDTIKHVVKEIQKGGHRFDPVAALKGQRPSNLDITPDGYINSYYENGSNLVKELNGKHVLDEATGALKSGLEPSYLEAAATKSAKYFVRQLDAANAAGVDLNKLTDAEQLLTATARLDAARDSPAKFNDVLKEFGWTHEEYVQRVLAANDYLDAQVVGQSSLTGIAGSLVAAEKEAANLPARLQDLASQRAYQESLVRVFGDSAALAKLERQSLNALFDGQPATPPDARSVSAHKQFEASGQAARLAGISQEEMAGIVAAVPQSGDPAAWFAGSASALEKAALDRLSSRPASPASAATSSLPSATRRAIGLPETGGGAEDLERLLRGTGGRVSTLGSATAPDVLQSHLAADRAVLVSMPVPASAERSWARLLGVNDSTVRVTDPATGDPVAYPRSVFDQVTRDQEGYFILDPWRDTEGAPRAEPAPVPRVLADLDELLTPAVE